MSVVADERTLISGLSVTAGTGVVYTVGQSERLTLETITFVLTADATAIGRNPQVVFADPDGNRFATVPDWNDLPASGVGTYTFGLGLTASCGTGLTGQVVQNDLPWTVLEPGYSVILESLRVDTFAVVPGDTFTQVFLYGVSASTIATPDVVPLLTPIALDEQAAAA